MWAGTADVPRAAEAARPRSSCWKTDDADPALLALALGARVRADLFLGNGLDLEAAERALEAELAGPPPAAVDTRMVFKLGQWLRYVDDLDGARLRLEQAERRRARRATSRRSPTSCSTGRCSSAGPATGRRRSSWPTGRTRRSS